MSVSATGFRTWALRIQDCTHWRRWRPSSWGFSAIFHITHTHIHTRIFQNICMHVWAHMFLCRGSQHLSQCGERTFLINFFHRHITLLLYHIHNTGPTYVQTYKQTYVNNSLVEVRKWNLLQIFSNNNRKVATPQQHTSAATVAVAFITHWWQLQPTTSAWHVCECACVRKPAPQFPLYFHCVLFWFRWPYANIKTTSMRTTFSRSPVYKSKK